MPLYALDDREPRVPLAGQYWVAPDAHVIGDVLLEADVGVWFGAVLRGDNEPIRIGAGTNIQEGVVVHTDPGSPATVGPRCTIGHRAIVHGCTLGATVLIGMGATIMNGAVIGDECLVGAGALVTEGRHFPPRSLIVGSPAKAIRTLDDAAVTSLNRSAARYIATWKRFAASLRRLD